MIRLTFPRRSRPLRNSRLAGLRAAWPVLATLALVVVPDVRAVELKVKYFGEPGVAVSIAEQAGEASLQAFYASNPDVRLKEWSSLRLPGDMFQQAELLAFAGGVAADVVPLFFHQIQFYAQQGLLAPLNEFIGEDTNGDGVLTDDEIRWKPWLDFPPVFRRACMVGTRIYAVPQGCYGGGWMYRRDCFLKAGLDPDKPPATLDEFWRTAQCLTRPVEGEANGQWAFAAGDLTFHNLFLAYGVQMVRVDWCDEAGKVVGRSGLEDDWIPFQKRKLTPRWRASFDTPEAAEAVDWIRKFRWQPWVRDPKTGAIHDLTEAEAAVTPGVIRGVAYESESAQKESARDLFDRGVIVMLNRTISARSGEPPSNAGIMPFPAKAAGDPSPTLLLPVTVGINSAIKDPAVRSAAWRWLAYQAGPESSRVANEVYARNGMLKAVSTYELHRSGMTNELAELPAAWRAGQERIFSTPHVLPFVNGWLPIEQEINSGVVKPLLGDRSFDFRTALGRVCQRANEKVFGDVPAAEQRAREGKAMWVLAGTLLLLIAGGTLIVRHQLAMAHEAALRNRGSRGAGRREMLLAALLLLPALALIFVFHYYPVGRGSVMAVQDYRLVGGSHYVGLHNFTEGLFASRLGLAAVNSLVFVSLTLGLGFVAPIVLAIMLSELPHGTGLYRSIYYLPAVTSGLVVILLWMQLYEPTASGTLNRLLYPFIAGWNHLVPSLLQIGWPIRWLQDPKWAMLATILPGVWAGAGPGCLIYLAALKSIPEDMYEAADLDGAGLWTKFLHVTLPGIGPLILINFVGALIGAFHGMGNIFVMTGGGPNYATHVLSLEIWQNAFLYLRFGVATAQAWMVAACLIGLVVVQLRVLGKLDWRQAGR